MAKIAVCDDHPLINIAIRSLIGTVDYHTYAWSSTDYVSTLKKIEDSRPDLLLLDINLGSETGFSILETIRNNQQDIKVIMLSFHSDQSLISKSKFLKANGYIRKDIVANDLLSAIDWVLANQGFYLLDTTPIETDQEESKEFARKELSSRELEIILLVANGKTSSVISERLSLSVHTVNTHRKHIMKKLNLNSIPELVHYCMDMKLTV